MPKDQQKSSKSRQRPISCQFCRLRKLRCSRTAPCSNCVSRGLTCDLEAPAAASSNAPSTSENSEIIERLHRLEHLLLTQKGEERGQNSQPSDGAESLRQHLPLSASPSQIQEVDVNSDIAWLGSLEADLLPSTRIPTSQLVFKTCSIAEAAKAQPYIYPSEFGGGPNSELSRCIWLPLRSEAQILLKKFINVAQHLPHVTHIPSLPSVLEQIYADLSQERKIQSGDLGRIILFLSIFAAATHSWVQKDCVYGLFSTPAEANDQATIWIRAAEEVLDLVCRSGKMSIEVVQGSIITAFVAAHVDGLHRYRVLFGTSVVLARDLGLHRIDHPSNADMANTAQAEIGRRVWWYLCASDWLMAARVGGMAEGIYSCHPRQMITKKPLNINDEEIFDGMSRDERPLSQPTTMSYTMQSIRLAEISRNTIDRSPLAMAHTGGLSHDAVMDIDTELQTLINDIPAFYSMSESTVMKTYGLTQTQAENIGFQGKIICFLLYLHRCKLHIPFFARSFEDPAYYASREICIKHARLIMQSELWQETSDFENAARFKFTALLFGVFLACIVLLMDLCVSPSSPQYERQREEVRKSFKIIEDVKNGSESTGKSVDALLHILRKHNVSPLGAGLNHPPQPGTGGDGGSERQSQTTPFTDLAFDIPDAPGYDENFEIALPGASRGQLGVGDSFDLDMTAEGPPNEAGEDLSSYWNEFTRSFEQGIDFSSFDWEKIFLELDPAFV